MKAQDLVFNELKDENTPDLTCNICDKVGGIGFFMADVKIAVDATFSLVVCSKKCEFDLKNHKGVDYYLKERISQMRRIHRNQAIKKMGRK